MTVATLTKSSNFKNFVAALIVPVLGAAYTAFILGAPLVG